jgi:hypothetical protein
MGYELSLFCRRTQGLASRRTAVNYVDGVIHPVNETGIKFIHHLPLTPTNQIPPQIILPARPAVMMEDIISALLPTAPPQPGIKRQPPPPIFSVSFRLAVKLAVLRLGTNKEDAESSTGVGIIA